MSVTISAASIQLQVSAIEMSSGRGRPENIETEYPSKEYSSGQYDEHEISSKVFVVIESESPGGSRVRVRGLGYHRISSGRELI